MAPRTEIPQFACSELPKAVADSGSSADAKGATGEFELAVNMEGGVGTLLAPSEVRNTFGALYIAPRMGFPLSAGSAQPDAVINSRRSADVAALSHNAAGPAGAKTGGGTGMPSRQFRASICLGALGPEPRESLPRCKSWLL